MTLPRDNATTPIAEFFRDVGTIPELLKRRVELTPTAVAFLRQTTSSAWEPMRWDEFDRRCDALAGALQSRGLTSGSRIGILAPASVDWEIVQMAALRCGAVVVGLDPYYPDPLLNELIEALGLAALVVQDETMRDRVTQATQARLEMIVDVPLLQQMGNEGGGRMPTSNSLARRDAAAVVTLSSGSTGRPQPIVYSHAQVVHAVRCILEAYPTLSADTRLVAWLPLANLFQRMIDLCAIAKGATSYIVGDPRHVMQVLPAARPHVLIAVPTFCERVHAGIVEQLARKPALARVVNRAVALAGEVREAETAGTPPSVFRRWVFRAVDCAILARLRAPFGGHLQFIVTGSAPMPRRLLDWYSAIGIPVLEAYGASENLVPLAANRLGAAKPGTVGQPLGDNQLRIAANGEVQVRGFGVFDPALAENATRSAAITEDGFLMTGDLGSLDGEGFLTLLGRASDVFKNSQGRWVSLPLLEAALRQIQGVEHAAAVRMQGDRLVGVLALPPAGRQPPEAREPGFEAVLRSRIAEALAQLPGASRPVGILVVKAGFAPASGELTTNLKLRRNAIFKRYRASLEQLATPGRSGSSEVPLQFG